MSRRREAHELARALLLSTQDARAAAKLSPHSISVSSSEGSRDMELTVCEDGSGMGMGLGRGGQGSVRPGDVMRPPEELTPVGSSFTSTSAATGSAGPSGNGSGEGGGHRSRDGEEIDTVGSTSIHTTTSLIQSFTPSHSHPHPPPTFPPTFPPTSSIAQASIAPHHISSPMLPPPVPSDKAPITESSGSSHRPLFSPTQGSLKHMEVTGLPSIKTYSKRSPEKRPNYRVSSSPEGEPVLVRPAGGRTAKGKIVIDDSSEAEAEEVVEYGETALRDQNKAKMRTPLEGNSKRGVEVVLPGRAEKRKGQVGIGGEKEKERGTEKHHSPDPLDSIVRSSKTPSSRRGSTASAAPASSAVTAEAEGGSRRISSRVQAAQERKEKEKEDRRAKRRREKEEKLRAEAGSVAEKQRRDQQETGPSRRGESSRSEATPKERRTRTSRGEQGMPIGLGDDDEYVVIGEDLKGRGDEPSAGATARSPKKVRASSPVQAPPIEDEAKANGMASLNKRKAADVYEDDNDAFDSRGAGKGKKKAKKALVKKSPAQKARPEAKIATPETIAGELPELETMEEHVQDETEPEAVVAEAVLAKEPSPPPKLSPPKKVVHGSTKLVDLPTNVQRHSPGPSNLPGGIKWKTSRSDLSSVLAKFAPARQSGMSRRHRIVPLHAKIGPPAKALPPAPVKPVKKKKGEESEDEEEEDEEGDEDDDDGEGRKAKAKKAKAMEWYMVED